MCLTVSSSEDSQQNLPLPRDPGSSIAGGSVVLAHTGPNILAHLPGKVQFFILTEIPLKHFDQKVSLYF